MLSAVEATWLNDRKYERLAEESACDAQGSAVDELDWEYLRRINPDAAAWLRVKGTDIDTPVVRPSRDKPRGWYLRHDFWGALNELGCPYVDDRCAETGLHTLVYGHRVSRDGQMFTELAMAHRQEKFARLGAASWQTPAESLTLEPLLAMKVDKTEGEIQRFDFVSHVAFGEWIEDLLERAGAVSADAQGLASRAHRALTLVTCSNPKAGQRDRTLVVFVAPPS